MAKIELSSKRVQLSKANMYIVAIVSAACFVSIFSLTASKMLFSQMSYQSKVIDKKEVAKKQLQDNVKARDQLVSAYKLFAKSTTGSNIIGGSLSGQSDRDGDNARIVLDALPSKYDYPALTTSLEKLMSSSNLAINSIAGTDDEAAQAGGEASANPQPVDMPFTVSFDATYTDTEKFFGLLQRSIRPIKVQQITVTGSDNRLSTSITAKTYYQPEKALIIQSEAVK